MADSGDLVGRNKKDAMSNSSSQLLDNDNEIQSLVLRYGKKSFLSGGVLNQELVIPGLDLGDQSDKTAPITRR